MHIRWVLLLTATFSTVGALDKDVLLEAMYASENSRDRVSDKQKIHGIVETVAGWMAQDGLSHSDNERNNTSNVLDEFPFVTLTYAQSLDGKIGLRDSQNASSVNLPISGKESLLMTHALRSIHDAILVGGATFTIDNPRLSNRLWGKKQPRPIVLDTNLCRLKTMASKRRAKNLFVCCSHQAAAKDDSVERFENDKVLIVPCNTNADGQLDVHDVLRRLRGLGIRSVMVEGGSSVLTSFLGAKRVDCLCVTIAPKFVGDEFGVPCVRRLTQDTPTTNRQQPTRVLDLAAGTFSHRSLSLGHDTIILARWKQQQQQQQK